MPLVAAYLPDSPPPCALIADYAQEGLGAREAGIEQIPPEHDAVAAVEREDYRVILASLTLVDRDRIGEIEEPQIVAGPVDQATVEVDGEDPPVDRPNTADVSVEDLHVVAVSRADHAVVETIFALAARDARGVGVQRRLKQCVESLSSKRASSCGRQDLDVGKPPCGQALGDHLHQGGASSLRIGAGQQEQI